MRAATIDPVQEQLTRPGGLADRLRQLRQRAGLNGKSLAAATGWQPSKVSRLENGRQRPTADDIHVWTRVCGADPDSIAALLALLSDLESLHRDWQLRMRRGQSPVQADYNQLVANSTLVTEEAFDPSLNPIRAGIDVSVQVLTYNDLTVTDPGYALFLVHQVMKEALATAATVAGAISTVAPVAGL
jgi:transcriptional regulator with XRE-family HTH domain